LWADQKNGTLKKVRVIALGVEIVFLTATKTAVAQPAAQRSYLRVVRRAALAGMIGPIVFGGVIAGLTIAQYQFMRGLRWHPLTAPTTDWPSGLALGPYGAIMNAAFVLSGGLLVVFAIGLRRALQRTSASRTGTLLLAFAGGAMALLALNVDPTYRDTPATWHGIAHDLAYVLLGITFLPALLLLAAHFRREGRWRGHALYTLLTVLFVGPAFALKGVMFYLFLIGALSWIEVTAVRLWRTARG
jgi:hypothetical protein